MIRLALVAPLLLLTGCLGMMGDRYAAAEWHVDGRTSGHGLYQPAKAYDIEVPSGVRALIVNLTYHPKGAGWVFLEDGNGNDVQHETFDHGPDHVREPWVTVASPAAGKWTLMFAVEVEKTLTYAVGVDYVTNS